MTGRPRVLGVVLALAAAASTRRARAVEPQVDNGDAVSRGDSGATSGPLPADASPAAPTPPATTTRMTTIATADGAPSTPKLTPAAEATDPPAAKPTSDPTPAPPPRPGAPVPPAGCSPAGAATKALPGYQAGAAPQRTKSVQELEPQVARFWLFNDNYFAWQPNSDGRTRVKFQVSVRYDMLTFQPGATSLSLNIAYTQKSFWDLFAFSRSSPFVETNYKPELF